MKPALVSCIIPVHNGERYLDETLDSVIAQSYRPIEVIVVDDGSTDRSAEIVAARGDRLTLLCQANAGVASARNRGLEAVKSEFVAFGDHDDIWHPERLSRQMPCFTDRPDLDMCIAHIKSFWTPDLADQRDDYSDPLVDVVAPATVTTGMVVRRAVFDRIGVFDSAFRVADHQDWYLRAIDGGAVIELLPDVLQYRRLHATNMTRTEAPRYAVELAEIVKRSLDRRRRQGSGRVRPLDLPVVADST